jgi:hypothetical protein
VNMGKGPRHKIIANLRFNSFVDSGLTTTVSGFFHRFPEKRTEIECQHPTNWLFGCCDTAGWRACGVLPSPTSVVSESRGCCEFFRLPPSVAGCSRLSSMLPLRCDLLRLLLRKVRACTPVCEVCQRGQTKAHARVLFVRFVANWVWRTVNSTEWPTLCRGRFYQAEREIAALADEMLKHDELYYSDSAPCISDEAYDDLARKAAKLESKQVHPANHCHSHCEACLVADCCLQGLSHVFCCGLGGMATECAIPA